MSDPWDDLLSIGAAPPAAAPTVAAPAPATGAGWDDLPPPPAAVFSQPAAAGGGEYASRESAERRARERAVCDRVRAILEPVGEDQRELDADEALLAELATMVGEPGLRVLDAWGVEHEVLARVGFPGSTVGLARDPRSGEVAFAWASPDEPARWAWPSVIVGRFIAERQQRRGHGRLRPLRGAPEGDPHPGVLGELLQAVADEQRRRVAESQGRRVAREAERKAREAREAAALEALEEEPPF